MTRPLPMKRLLLATAALLAAPAAHAAETIVAVAANFTEPATEIAALFAEETGHTAVLSFGATGQFYTQITQGAPFEVFLAADDIRPTQAVEEGYGVEGTVFTYAIGQLVLWSADADLITGEDTLAAGDFNNLSIANPETAPYGLAAMQTLESLDLLDEVQPKIVQGTNISQALQFIDTGNAELGFVALSQVIMNESGSHWIVPAEYHAPIRQDVVLLTTGAENEAAVAFIEFLQSPAAIEVIERYGYALDTADAAG